MKSLFTSFLLCLIFITSNCHKSAVAQSISKTPNYIKQTESFELKQNRPGPYNPWTIHKKVSAIGFSGSIAATFVGALSMDDNFFGTTVIPVVGPFVTITRIENDPNSFYRPGGKKLLTASGIVQSAFLVYFVTSIIGESNYQVKSQSSNFTVAPVPLSKGAGISMNLRF